MIVVNTVILFRVKHSTSQCQNYLCKNFCEELSSSHNILLSIHMSGSCHASGEFSMFDFMAGLKYIVVFNKVSIPNSFGHFNSDKII